MPSYGRGLGDIASHSSHPALHDFQQLLDVLGGVYGRLLVKSVKERGAHRSGIRVGSTYGE
jgi:hypothetical protein